MIHPADANKNDGVLHLETVVHVSHRSQPLLMALGPNNGIRSVESFVRRRQARP